MKQQSNFFSRTLAFLLEGAAALILLSVALTILQRLSAQPTFVQLDMPVNVGDVLQRLLTIIRG